MNAAVQPKHQLVAGLKLHIGIALAGLILGRRAVPYQRRMAAPARQADGQLSLAFQRPETHFHLIGIAGLALKPQTVVKPHLALGVQVAERSGLVLAVGILTEGTQQPRHIGRAAGAGVPAGTHRQVVQVGNRLAGHAGNHFQRVHIEETLTVQLHSRQHRVVEGPFHHVGVFRVRVHFQHPGRKEHQADPGAGLRISSVVGQIVIHGEGLALTGGADTAGDIHPPMGRAFPQAAASGFQRRVFSLRGQVGHGGVQIHGADAVPRRVAQLPDGLIALHILSVLHVHMPLRPVPLLRFLPIEVAVHAAHVDKMLCQLQAVLVAGDAVQLQQRQFHLRVARIARLALHHEPLIQVFRVADHHVQQRPFARSLKVRRGSLHHVAHTVQLVPLAQVRPALVPILQREPGVQIAVLVLCLRDQLDQLVGFFFQLCVREAGQGAGHRFQPLGRVAVLKDHAIEAVPRILAPEHPSGVAEVGDHVAFFHTLHLIVQHLILVGDHHVLHQLLVMINKSVGALIAFGVDLPLYLHFALSFVCIDIFPYLYYHPAERDKT